MENLKFELLAAGYCTAGQHHALMGASRKDIVFRASFGLILHPRHGAILFDTGYTQRFYQYTKNYPAKIYAQITKVFIKPEEEAHRQLASRNIQPEEVKYIIISHFHADHIGGLADFPNATFICSKRAYEDVKSRKGFAALQKGFIPGLLPADFEKRLRLIDLETGQTPHEILGQLSDLFNDGTMMLCALGGHAKGQMGLIMNTEGFATFLIADAAWLKPTYQKLHLPNPIVRLFFDSWTDFKNSLGRVHLYHLQNPEVRIIPCHCEETFLEITASQQ